MADAWGGAWGDAWGDAWGGESVAVNDPLTIDGSVVRVLQGSHTEAALALAPSSESQAGEWRSERRATAGRNLGRRWGPFQTPDMDVADGLTLIATLVQPGQRTAAGYLVSSESGIGAYVRDVEPVWGDSTLYMAVRFTLEAATP
jgi:hypothetical protein